MSPATLCAKRYVLERFARVSEIESVGGLTNEKFNAWVKHESARGISVGSSNIYNSIVVAFARYYREMGVNVPLNILLIERARDLTPVASRKFYTAEDVARVVDLADFETGLMIRILFETGMRIAELVRLKVGDFDGRRIRFIGKGRRLREVYIREETLGLVNQYALQYHIKSGYLWVGNDGFVTLNGEPPTVNTVRTRLRKAFEAAGFDGFYPHALRHSFATDLQMRGASISEIKEMIGHSSVATTERYLHGFEGRMQELFDKYR